MIKKWKFIVSSVFMLLLTLGVNLIFINNSVFSMELKSEGSNESILRILEGTWEGVDNDKYHGTELIIEISDENSFQFDMESFWLNTKGFPNVGECSGKGYLKDEFIELDFEEGILKGKMTIIKDQIHIDYQGDISQLGGVNVSFSTDFKKKK